MTNLTYIEVNNLKDLHQFIQWLDNQNKFPFSFYLDGFTYTIQDEIWRDVYIVAFYAGLDIGGRVNYKGR